MMFSSIVRRSLLRSDVFGVPQLRSFSSTLPMANDRREMHNSARREANVMAAPLEVAKNQEEVTKNAFVNRFVVTGEVTVSKIFPAGFGWQSASIFAETNGYAADSMAFALSTGLGDAIGVFAGHCAYYGIKKTVVDKSIDMNKELQTGIFLGSAAFCSGTAWQPLVDALQGANLNFVQVFAGTWVGCATAFYVGLRAARTVLSGFLEHIEEPTYENSLNDKSLSAAIGGATGFFVGTDVAYLPTQNFLIDVVGITDTNPALTGCAIAGTSTAMGFVSAQSALNVIYPAGRCWND